MQLIGKAVSVRSVLLSLSAILFLKYKSVKSGEEVAGGGKGNTISDEELYRAISEPSGRSR